MLVSTPCGELRPPQWQRPAGSRPGGSAPQPAASEPLLRCLQYKNKARQKAFLAVQAARAAEQEAQQAGSQATRKRRREQGPAKAQPARKLPAERRRKAEAAQDVEDFAAEARLLKKLKRGALTEVGWPPSLLCSHMRLGPLSMQAPAQAAYEAAVEAAAAKPAQQAARQSARSTAAQQQQQRKRRSLRA